jgi:ankyrin repeat protein
MGATIEAKAKINGPTPLLTASRRGNVDIMKILIDAGADIHASYLNYLGGRHINALSDAISSGNVEAVKLLLTSGLKTLYDEERGTPIHHAATSCNPSAQMLLLLLELGAGEVSAIDHSYRGLTALQCVASLPATDPTGITESLAALLDHGAAIDQLSDDGQTAFHYAIDNRNTPAVLFLLDRGANVALVYRNGLTALHKSAIRGVEMVTTLLDHGAVVNAVDRQGQTSLHCFTALRDATAVPAAKLLLQAGANANATNANDDTPLHLWAMNSYNVEVEFAQLLIDNGADVAAHNNKNQRPCDVARIGTPRHAFLLAAEEAQRNNHRYKRPRPEDLQPPVVAAGAAAEAAAAAEQEEEEEDESEDDSDDEDEED